MREGREGEEREGEEVRERERGKRECEERAEMRGGGRKERLHETKSNPQFP